jgi:hypothetical protein
MADWPDTDELKQILDITNEDWDEQLDGVLKSAIGQVKHDVGDWDEAVDTPDDSLSRAGLRLAELQALRPDSARGTERDPVYLRYLKGHRRKFGIA